jgi:hypothetical protein
LEFGYSYKLEANVKYQNVIKTIPVIFEIVPAIKEGKLVISPSTG